MAKRDTGERVVCRTITPGKTGVTRIPRWKFDCVREAILDELSRHPVPFAELTSRVRDRLSPEELDKMGSLGWHVTSVKLELEVRDEIRRQKGPGKQILELGSTS